MLKTSLLIALLATSLPALAAHKAAAKLECLSATTPPSNPPLPAQLLVGVETIHKDATKIITIYVPMTADGTPSRVLDTNEKDPAQRHSKRFVISDGSVKTAFIGVDATAGSKLDACLQEITQRIQSKEPEAVHKFIRDHLQSDYLREPTPHFVFDWDKASKPESEALVELYHSAKDMAVGQYPVRSQQTNTVVPLERFLEVGHGTCLHKALLASLILTRLGIPHRLVNGATQGGGHSWIELKDGRILDPSLGLLTQPQPSKALPGWFKYGDHLAFEDQVWPFLALD